MAISNATALLLLVTAAQLILCTRAFQLRRLENKVAPASNGICVGNRRHGVRMHSSVSSSPQSTDDLEIMIEESRRKFLAWAASNIVDLDDEDALEAIASTIGDARVVALSEGCHNSREMMQSHSRLVRHLVEKHNFTAVVTETGLPESRLIFDYVNGQDVPDREEMYKKGLNQMYSAWVEGRELIEWMRDYNRHQNNAENTLSYYGIDIGGFYQDWKTPLGEVLGYLKRYAFSAEGAYAILDITKRLQPILDAMGEVAREHYTERMTARERADLALLLDETFEVFQQKESEYVDRGGRSEYEWARQSLVSMQLAENYYRNYMDMRSAETSKFVGLIGREIAMYQNICWVMRQHPASKIIWINHVVHTKTESQYQGDMWGFFTPAGEMLRQSLGDDLFSISLCYGSGEYWKDWQKGAEKRSVAAVPDAREDGLEVTLGPLMESSKAIKSVFIPWGNAPVGAWPWLQSICSMRENDYFLNIKPSEWQACIYIDTVSPATPISSCFE